jgi:hypothetical protein
MQDALTEILRTAADLPTGEDGPDIASHLQQWEPVIADVIAACQAGQEPPADLLEFLDKRAKDPDWVALAAVLHRILAGERGEPLLDGLDPIDTAIARETLARLTWPAGLRLQLRSRQADVSAETPREEFHKPDPRPQRPCRSIEPRHGNG